MKTVRRFLILLAVSAGSMGLHGAPFCNKIQEESLKAIIKFPQYNEQLIMLHMLVFSGVSLGYVRTELVSQMAVNTSVWQRM